MAFSSSSAGQSLVFEGSSPFGSSNPSTRRKIENGSMEIRKKLGAKKAEKSFEISAFLSLLYHKSDIFSSEIFGLRRM